MHRMLQIRLRAGAWSLIKNEASGTLRKRETINNSMISIRYKNNNELQKQIPAHNKKNINALGALLLSKSCC